MFFLVGMLGIIFYREVCVLGSLVFLGFFWRDLYILDVVISLCGFSCFFSVIFLVGIRKIL